MKRLAILTSFLCLSVTGFTQERTAPEQGLPPTNLEQRDGHWTANEVPPDTTDFEVHIVASGDTLWAIAERFMGNPFLWPQLWETNGHIINPHWIYPEDQILIRPVTQISDVVPPPQPQQLPEVSTPAPPRTVQLPTLGLVAAEELPPPDSYVLDLSEPRPVPAVKVSDLYCSGFVTTRDIQAGGGLVARFPTDDGLLSTEGNYVYINQGSASGVDTGDLFTVVRATREIESTRAGVGNLGRHFLELGQLSTVIVQPEFSLARIIHSCGAMEVGDSIVAFEEIDFPELPTRRAFSAFMPSTGKTAGAIATARSPLLNSRSPLLGGTTTVPGILSGHLSGLARGLVSEGDVVYLDLGLADSIAVGDTFLIYRPLEFDSQFAAPEAASLLGPQREVIGELVVLKVRERASTALITFASRGVSAGDSVELR